jgi:imidazolonepropionase-like amidohydrolase
MTDDELDAVVEATHHRGKKVRAHVTATPYILKCIETGVDLLDHADRMDARCIDALAAAGTGVCPSLYLTRAILDRIAADRRADEPFFRAMQADYDNMCGMLPAAEGAGVNLLVGDDWGTAMTPHGDYIKEMELYVNEVGIDALDVVRWATRHGAEAMGLGDDLGTIAQGKLADLLVVDGDPSSDISVLADTDNLLCIMKDGLFVKRTIRPTEAS